MIIALGSNFFGIPEQILRKMPENRLHCLWPVILPVMSGFENDMDKRSG